MAGDLAEPGPSAILTFFHRIQRAKAWAFGHVRCAQLSAPLSSTARRAGAPCRFCQSHEPQRGRPGSGIIIQKGLSHDNGSYPRGRADPVAYFPEHCFLENLVVRADGSVLVTTVLKARSMSSSTADRWSQ